MEEPEPTFEALAAEYEVDAAEIADPGAVLAHGHGPASLLTPASGGLQSSASGGLHSSGATA